MAICSQKEERVVDEATMTIFAMGTDTGELVRDFFPGGVMAVEEDWPTYESAKRTQELISAGVETIYEATFIYDQTLVAVDIITKIDDKWHLFEMKSNNSVKPQHIKDVAIQYYVVSGSGLTLANAFVMHMNRDYVRQGELDVQQLFVYESVLDEVLQLQDFVNTNIQDLLLVEQSEDEPEREMGRQCTSPYSCDYADYCSLLKQTKITTDPSSTNPVPTCPAALIPSSTVPPCPGALVPPCPDTLIPPPRLSNKPTVNRPAIRQFLKTVPYPLYYLDFETIMPCVPMFNESRPSQQLPFQYSLHYRSSGGAELEHFGYLADHISDPRIALIPFPYGIINFAVKG